MTNPVKEVQILLVEDNLADQILATHALQTTGWGKALQIVEDGEEALNYLKKLGPHHKAPNPDLILLDLNLPKKDGISVLREIKNDFQLCHIPVIILTSSQASKDINDCYEAGANCYLTKAQGLDEYLLVMKAIQDFWLYSVKFPLQNNHPEQTTRPSFIK